MKRLWRNSNLGGKIVLSVCVAVSIAILAGLYGYVKQGFKRDINKDDIEKIEQLQEDAKEMKNNFQRIEDHIENSATAWKATYEGIQQINSRFDIIEYRLKKNEENIEDIIAGDRARWRKEFEDDLKYKEKRRREIEKQDKDYAERIKEWEERGDKTEALIKKLEEILNK